jgi:hypothetical protein
LKGKIAVPTSHIALKTAIVLRKYLRVMLSVEKVKEILEKHGEQHSYEQIKEIRDILYSFRLLNYEIYQQKKLQHESNNLHPGINRRTG